MAAPAQRRWRRRPQHIQWGPRRGGGPGGAPADNGGNGDTDGRLRRRRRRGEGGGLGGISRDGYGGDGGADVQAGTAATEWRLIDQEAGLPDPQLHLPTTRPRGNNGTAPPRRHRAPRRRDPNRRRQPRKCPPEQHVRRETGLFISGAGTAAAPHRGGTLTVNNDLVAEAPTFTERPERHGGSVTGQQPLPSPGALGGLAGAVGGYRASRHWAISAPPPRPSPSWQPRHQRGLHDRHTRSRSRGITRGAAEDIAAFESRGFFLAITAGNNQVAVADSALPSAAGGLRHLRVRRAVDGAPSPSRPTPPPAAPARSSTRPIPRPARGQASTHPRQRERGQATSPPPPPAPLGSTFDLQNKAVATIRIRRHQTIASPSGSTHRFPRRRDSSGDPVTGVPITLSLSPSSPTPGPSPFTAITDANGERTSIRACGSRGPAGIVTVPPPGE